VLCYCVRTIGVNGSVKL